MQERDETIFFQNLSSKGSVQWYTVYTKPYLQLEYYFPKCTIAAKIDFKVEVQHKAMCFFDLL